MRGVCKITGADGDKTVIFKAIDRCLWPAVGWRLRSAEGRELRVGTLEWLTRAAAWDPTRLRVGQGLGPYPRPMPLLHRQYYIASKNCTILTWPRM